jgi:hypothetical protein
MTEQTAVQASPPVSNPLLERLRLPGETFRLPSMGVFYTNGELDESVSNGEIEVYPMTAMDEVILSTPDKLLSGKAIEEVFTRCIPQIKRPREMLSQDVDFIMVCLRMVSFGQSMSVVYKHICKEAKDHTYEIDLQRLIKNTTSLDPTSLKIDYQVKMPNGQVVDLKPMTFGSIIELYETTMLIKQNQDQGELTEKEMEKIIVGTLSNIIDRVDTVTDKKMIVEWVTKIPLGWKKQIEQSAQNVSKWGVDFKVARKCKDCGVEFETLVNTNPVSFFT